jgi:hypothetical protein
MFKLKYEPYPKKMYISFAFEFMMPGVLRCLVSQAPDYKSEKIERDFSTVPSAG